MKHCKYIHLAINHHSLKIYHFIEGLVLHLLLLALVLVVVLLWVSLACHMSCLHHQLQRVEDPVCVCVCVCGWAGELMNVETLKICV